MRIYIHSDPLHDDDRILDPFRDAFVGLEVEALGRIRDAFYPRGGYRVTMGVLLEALKKERPDIYYFVSTMRRPFSLHTGSELDDETIVLPQESCDVIGAVN